MKTLSVTILDKDTAGSYTETVQFDTVESFMQKVDEIIDGTGFRKCYPDFDEMEFTKEEREKLRGEDFIL